jgi:hypothetical protein
MVHAESFVNRNRRNCGKIRNVFRNSRTLSKQNEQPQNNYAFNSGIYFGARIGLTLLGLKPNCGAPARIASTM